MTDGVKLASGIELGPMLGSADGKEEKVINGCALGPVESNECGLNCVGPLVAGATLAEIVVGVSVVGPAMV